MPTSGFYVYDIYNGNEANITSYLGPGGDVQIPEFLDGLLVTRISSSVFSHKSAITSVNIPFGVTTIGPDAFYYCTNLTSITLPNNLNTIYARAFESTAISSITIPEFTNIIDANSFSSCLNLNEAKFWGNAPMMGADVFSNHSPMFKIIYYSGRSGYTAGWHGYQTEPFYIVTYDDNGSASGTVPEDKNTYLQNQWIQVQNNTGSLVRTGYIFKGWNSSPSGDGINYDPGDFFQIGNSHLTLYAKWAQLPSRGIKLF